MHHSYVLQDHHTNPHSFFFPKEKSHINTFFFSSTPREKLLYKWVGHRHGFNSNAYSYIKTAKRNFYSAAEMDKDILRLETDVMLEKQ